MAQNQATAKLHLLTAREILAAGDGDYADGGGLMLRVRGPSASFVYRFTSATGRRREMGLGVARRGSPKQAGDSLVSAREEAHKAREQVKRGDRRPHRRARRPQTSRTGRRSGQEGRAKARADDARQGRPRLSRARHQADPELKARGELDRLARAPHPGFSLARTDRVDHRSGASCRDAHDPISRGLVDADSRHAAAHEAASRRRVRGCDLSRPLHDEPGGGDPQEDARGDAAPGSRPAQGACVPRGTGIHGAAARGAGGRCPLLRVLDPHGLSH